MVGCSAPNCTNNSRQGKYKFYRFPRDESRRRIWMENCKRKNWWPSTNHCLCNVHFEQSQFELHRADGRIKLKPYAIPTIFYNTNDGDLSDESNRNYCLGFDTKDPLDIEVCIKELSSDEENCSDDFYKNQVFALKTELESKNQELIMAKEEISSLKLELKKRDEILKQFLSGNTFQIIKKEEIF